MLQIIILIFVLAWFVRTARRLGRSQVIWPIVGAVSYLVPALLFGQIVVPMLVGSSVTPTTYVAMIIVSIGVGLAGCLVAGKSLINMGPDEHLESGGPVGTNIDGEVIVQCGDCRWKGSEFELSSNDDNTGDFVYCPNCGARVADG